MIHVAVEISCCSGIAFFLQLIVNAVVYILKVPGNATKMTKGKGQYNAWIVIIIIIDIIRIIIVFSVKSA